MPAAAATFTPFTMNLSATDASNATFTFNFDPGTYVVSLTQDLYTAFAPATPAAGNWTDYYQYSINGGSNQYWNPVGDAGGPYKFATMADAYNAFSAAPKLTLSFTTATSVKFQVGDSLSSLGDNTGGTSLRVTAVPEASTWAMMVIGFGAIGYGLRRSKTTAVRFA